MKWTVLSLGVIQLSLLLWIPIHADVVKTNSPAAGASAVGNNAWTGTNSFIDGSFTLIGSAGATKIAKFEVDTLVPVGTNTYTFPAASGTLALLGANVFTGAQTFSTTATLNTDSYFVVGSAGGAASNAVYFSSLQTPDTAFLSTSSTGNSWIIAETADTGFDFAHAQQATPTIFFHSGVQNTTSWGSVTHNNTDFVLGTGAGDLKLTAAGHVKMTGTAPAVSACGTTPSAVTGSDHAGKVTTGSGGTVQSCTLTFAVAYGVAPACTVSDETGILLVRATSTTTTLVLDSAVAGTLASSTLAYICLQGS